MTPRARASHILARSKAPRKFKPNPRILPKFDANPASGFPTGLTDPIGVINQPGRTIRKFVTVPISLAFDGGAIVGTARLVLLFWGDFWQTASNPSVSDVQQAVSDILNSPYLSEMAQYGFRGLTLDPPRIVHKPGPPFPTFSGDDAKNMVWDLIDDDVFPEPDDDSGEGRIVYMVFAPPGTAYEDTGAGGAHGEASDYDFPFDVDYAWVGWVDHGNLDMITSFFSHELVEILSDPEPFSGWHVTSPPEIDEIADACILQVGLSNGRVVAAYYSKNLNACVVPDFPQPRSLDLDVKQFGEGPAFLLGGGSIDVASGPCFSGHYEWEVLGRRSETVITANIAGYEDPEFTWTVDASTVFDFPTPVSTSQDAPILDPLHYLEKLPPWTSTVQASAKDGVLTLNMAPGQYPVYYLATCTVEEKGLPAGYATKRSDSVGVFMSSAFRLMDARFESDLEMCQAKAKAFSRKDLEYKLPIVFDPGDPPPPWVGYEHLPAELVRELDEIYFLATSVAHQDRKLAENLREFAAAKFVGALVKTLKQSKIADSEG
jgi:hypothetical protein